MTWSDEFYDFMFFPHRDQHLDELADLAEPEDWSYRNITTEHHKPILFNFIKYTYKRLAEEDKIAIANDATAVAFNTGLVTPSQEPIFCYATQNRLSDRSQPWHFHSWRRKGEHDLTRFSSLPEMAHYFDDPSCLIFDTRLELRTNVEHIISDNRERFPEPYRSMSEYQLQTFLKGALDNARERARRNYKTAVPQYYRGKIQLLLPLCLTSPAVADLALVVERNSGFYRASTCLTLDMAYNNSRQLARPDREWLQP